MPAFKFEGFTSGSTVAISAVQGASGASESVQNWEQPHLASVSILTRASASRVAPAGVWFEAIGISGFNVAGGPGPGETYDPSFHEITFVWTVRNQPLPAFTAPQNMVTGWNNPNVAYGKKVAFLFPQPGSYTVDLWAVDSQGTTGVAEVDVVVTDPDLAFPGTSTICYSDAPGETWAGEAQGCQRITSMAALDSALNDNTEKRVLFKRGSDVANAVVNISGNRKPAYVGAWGVGANPILRPTPRDEVIRVGSGGTTNLSEMMIDGIDFVGSWDAAAEAGYPSETPVHFLSQAQHLHLTIANSTFDGFSNVWLAVGGGHSGTTIVANTTCTNWRDYGYFVHPVDHANTILAFIGCRAAQHVDALNGAPDGASDPKNGFYNTHGPLRYADHTDVYVGMSDFFSRTGWSSLAPDTADQPCIRANTTVKADRAMVIDRSVFEGGFQVIALAGANSSNNEIPGNYVIDKSLLIGTTKTILLMQSEFGGTTLRNVVGIVPNVPLHHFWVAPMQYFVDNNIADNLDDPQALYCSTFLNLRDAGNDENDAWVYVDNPAGFTNVTVENNVLHGPDLDAPVTPDAPVGLGQTIGGVTPRYKGVLYSPFGEESGAASVGNGGSFTLPYPAGTDQAYWQSLPASDDRHALQIGGDGYYAELGEMSVSFETGNVRVTNTSGESWSGSYILKLDRSSQLPSLNSVGASPASLPLPVPQAGSVALAGSGLGRAAHDDFFGTSRTATVAGAIQP